MIGKTIGLLVGSAAVVAMACAYEPVADATSSYGSGGAGETSVQQTGGGGLSPTSVVITGPKVLSPPCSVYETANGYCP